jgi:SAM-dependent methyltransferase
MKISNCRLCHSDKINEIINLGSQPLADTFLYEKELYSKGEVYYPLTLSLCDSCKHVFTSHFIPPEKRYQETEYSYDSSNSSVSIMHFENFSKAVNQKLNLSSDSRIADIGSNVGTLLLNFIKIGFTDVLGIEPSSNICEIANTNGVKTINRFFDNSIENEITQNGKFDVLLSSNVVNHIDDLNGFFDLANKILNKNGHFVFEVPYLYDLVKTFAFDTIYHEHVNYFSLFTLNSFLNKKGFNIIDVEFLDYMCGSIRVYVAKGYIQNKNENLKKLIENEIASGIFDLKTYKKFMNELISLKFTTLSDLLKLKLEGNKIIGIGAATKGNTFLNFCSLDNHLIEYITDASQLKIGKLTPGSHIEIKSDDSIDNSVDIALILPWNISEYLTDKLSRHKNLKFYTPKIKRL